MRGSRICVNIFLARRIDGVTCHVRAWELPKREGMSPAEWAALTAARPHIPFDGRTTAQVCTQPCVYAYPINHCALAPATQEAYTAKPLERPPTAPVGYSYAPVPDNRDFKSESRAQHDWKEPEPICPAALLPPPPPASSGCVLATVSSLPLFDITSRVIPVGVQHLEWEAWSRAVGSSEATLVAQPLKPTYPTTTPSSTHSFN